MKIGRKVRYARHLRDLTQQELSVASGIAVSTIVRLERGKGRVPHQRTVGAIARALGVDEAWLTDETQDIPDVRQAQDPSRTAVASHGPAQGAPAQAPPTEGPAPVRAPGTDVVNLLRQAIRQIERTGRPADVTVEPVAGPPRIATPGERAAPERGGPPRLAPVFDIGADFENDWFDGEFPTGRGHDERPALNADPTGFWCLLHGDSMEPELLEGDLLYFSPGWATPRDGDICLVRTHDFATVKRVYFLGPDKVRLAATNPRYPDRVVHRVKDVIQLHKVVSFVRALR